MEFETDQARRKMQRIGRLAVRLVIVLALVYLAKTGFDLLKGRIALLESDAAARAMIGLILTVIIGYALLLAMPFIPGVEIGIAILALAGAKAAPLVYLATVTGLLLAFFIGQHAPLASLIRFCADLRLLRIAAILRRIESTPRDDRLHSLQATLPVWLVPVFCNYRYVALGLAINMPGNIVLGGGGGIMLASGLSRLFQSRFAVLTVLLATLPVPLAVWVLGTDILH